MRTMIVTILVLLAVGVTTMVEGVLAIPRAGMATSADAVSPAGSVLLSKSWKPARI